MFSFHHCIRYMDIKKIIFWLSNFFAVWLFFVKNNIINFLLPLKNHCLYVLKFFLGFSLLLTEYLARWWTNEIVDFRFIFFFSHSVSYIFTQRYFSRHFFLIIIIIYYKFHFFWQNCCISIYTIYWKEKQQLIHNFEFKNKT